MAWVIVRLKLALLRGGLRKSGLQGALGFAAALVLAITIGGLIGAGLLAIRALHGDDATDATAAAFAMMLIVWTLGPVIVGSEGTLDPDRLALFPLSRRELMPGLLAAGVVGFGGITTVLALVGSIGGMAPGSPLVVVTVAAAGAQLLLCAACSRLAGALISGAVRKRRWRDIALFIGPVIAISINVGVQVVSNSLTSRPGALREPSGSVEVARTIARLVPSGPAALAMGYAREGNLGPALVALSLAIGVVVVVVALWGRVLERVLTTATTGGTNIPARANSSLFPRLAPFLPRTRIGAVAAKELRLTWRDPRQRASLFGALFGALAPAFSLRLFVSGSPRALLIAAMPAYMLGALATNQFGFDGPAHWTNVSAGDDPRADLLGKNVSRLLVAAPLVALILFGLGARIGSLAFVGPAVGLSVAAFGINTGLGNVLSVMAPTAMPDTPSNVFSTGNAGQGLAAAGPSMAVLFGGMFLIAPVVVPAIVADSSTMLALVGLAGCLYGATAWWGGWQFASAWATTRQPEMLARLSVRH